ncbi:MAG: IPTL-CTERM sorting domain-containing protein, partial [Thermoanaerobaculia bacterium]|nr:IPTL-CTERM sorting domain-containing protein [Thermoanaerobaculia bacterium]
SPTGAPLLLMGLDEPVAEIPTTSTWGLLFLSLLLGLAGALLLRRHPGAGATLVLWLVVFTGGSGVLWALGTIILDGDPLDWTGIEDTIGLDPVGDALDVDIIAGFAVLSDDGTTIAFRFDVFRDVPPTAVDDALTVLEDSGTTAIDVLINDIDPDGGPILIESVTQPAQGVVAITGGGAGLSYQIAADVCNDGTPTDDFTYTLNGGSTGAVAVTVTCVNDEPSFTGGANQSVDEDAGPQSDVGWATGMDDGDGGTQILTFVVTNDNNALFTSQPAVDAITGTLTYESAPDASGLATVTVVLMDDGGIASGGDDSSPPQMFTITVTAMNDAPVCSGGGSVAVFMEDGGPVTINNALLVSDADDANLQSASMTITNLLDAGLEALAGATGGTAISASYAAPVLTLTGVDTVANYQQVLRSVTYDNSSQGPDPTNRVVTCVVSDGTDSSPADPMTVQVVSVNDPPTVTNSIINYSAVGNTLLRVDGPDADDHDSGLPGRIASTVDLTDAFVAADPSDPDSVNLGFIPKSSEATDQGGIITLDDDGDFYYIPPIGFTGVDTETLQLVDGDGGMVPVTLQITVSDVVWYVEDTIDGTNNPAGNADGRSTDAFQTLAAAEAASGEDHYILLFETDAPLDEGITLKSGQKFYGQRVEEEPVSLLPAGLLLEEIMDTDARPQIHRTTGVAVAVDASAAAMDNVEIRHLDLESGDDDAIQITTANAFAASILVDENVIGAAG